MTLFDLPPQRASLTCSSGSRSWIGSQRSRGPPAQHSACRKDTGFASPKPPGKFLPENLMPAQKFHGAWRPHYGSPHGRAATPRSKSTLTAASRPPTRVRRDPADPLPFLKLVKC